MTASAQKQRVSRLLCLLLCLVTWRGPLPVLHAHAAGPHASEQDPTLASHCQQFHVDVADDHELGWHLHLLLPWANGQSANEDSDTPEDPLLKSEVLLSSGSAPAIVVGISLDSWVCQSPAPAMFQRGLISDDVRCAHSFLNSLMQSVPLCAVTGVALC